MTLNMFLIHTSTSHIVQSDNSKYVKITTLYLIPTDIHTQTYESVVVIRKLHHGLVVLGHHVLPSLRLLTSCFVGTFDNFRDNLYIGLTCGFAFANKIK